METGKYFKVLYVDPDFDESGADEPIEYFYKYATFNYFKAACKWVKQHAKQMGMGGYAQISEISWEGPSRDSALTDTTELRKWEIAYADQEPVLS